MSNSRKIACARRHTHLLGEAYLGIRDINKAFHYFLRAAPLEPASLRTRYLLAIIETFSSTMGSPELALQCARIAIATCDSIMDVSVQENHRNTLWHIVFQQTLKCRRYDEACVAVSSLADANEQKVCLKRLIFDEIIATFLINSKIRKNIKKVKKIRKKFDAKYFNLIKKKN